MDKLVLFNSKQLKRLLVKGSNESKFGEYISVLTSVSNIYEQLKELDVKYVIIGLPEDVGVFANNRKPGTSVAYEATIKILLNIKSNQSALADKVLILGHLNFEKELEKLKQLDKTKKKDVVKARKMVSKMDKHVSILIHDIVKSGKIPIIIGGGQNNAYGNIKGTSLALNAPINAINFDLRTDFYPEDGRHSGNGFTYAYTEGFLKNYFVFGLHENYTSEKTFKTIKKLKKIDVSTFKDISIKKKSSFKKEMVRALKHVGNLPLGLEVDCNAIHKVTSMEIPSAFSKKQARRFVKFISKNNNVTYLHICEGVPEKGNESQIGKLITNLITDFIKANAD